MIGFEWWSNKLIIHRDFIKCELEKSLDWHNDQTNY